jgi:hypothetical protein
LAAEIQVEIQEGEYDRMFFLFLNKLATKKKQIKKRKKPAQNVETPPRMYVGRLSAVGVKSFDRCLSQSHHKIEPTAT